MNEKYVPPLTIICASDLPEPLPCPENPQILTLSQIIALEPRISGILSDIESGGSELQKLDQYCKCKGKLQKLVGWGAELSELRTSQVWGLVLNTVVGQLWPGYRYGVSTLPR